MKKTISNILIVIAVFGAMHLLVSTLPEAQLKCSDEYADTDAGSAEYLADFDKWTNNFYDTHPGAGLADWSKARYQFWEDNNCTESIEKYNEAKAGKADPATMRLINNGIKDAIDDNVSNRF